MIHRKLILDGYNEDREFKTELLSLLVKEKEIICLDEKVWLLSLLYAAGFLTGIPFTKEDKKINEFEFRLMVPNEEIFNFYIQELGLDKQEYPYQKRSEVIKKVSNNYYTQAKIDSVLSRLNIDDASDQKMLSLFYVCTWLSHASIPFTLLEALTKPSDVSRFIHELEKKILY